MQTKLIKQMYSTAAMTVLAAILAGCAVGTPYQRPEAAMPATWDGAVAAQAGQQNAASAITADWWKQFGSAELDMLMTQSLAANHDLGAAVSRIRQARAAASITDAARLPSVGLSASATQTRGRRNGIAADDEAGQAGVTVAYEADLWGGKAAQSEAARARVDSSVYSRDAVALVLQAELASNYFQALALKDRLGIARKNLDAARNVLSLTETRFNKGANTGLEVAQQRTAVLNIEAQIPQLEQDLRATQSAIAILLGRTPQGFAIQGETLAGIGAPVVAAYQPPALLERRPDVRQAEAELMAANADIGAARAALYPKLQLGLSTVAGGILSPGSSLITSLLASLTQTAFDGGQLRGRVTQSEARKSELVEQYLQGILTALKEAQDGFGAVAAAEQRQDILGRATLEAQEAYRIASVRYRAGSQDLLTLLDSQRTQLQAEDSRVQADLARMTATVGLFKALGGGWPI
jgi:NodT family efflux transporter outer membrane factor (OMF) lipoprotein